MLYSITAANEQKWIQIFKRSHYIAEYINLKYLPIKNPQSDNLIEI